MGTTFAILDGGGRFSQASTPAETTHYNYAITGATTGLTALNGTLSANATDPLGGTNAVSFTCDSDGAGAQVGMQVASSAYPKQLLKVRFQIKKGAWASAQAWIRPRFANMILNPYISCNLDSTTQNNGSNMTNPSWTSLGSGWYQFYGEVDFSVYTTEDTTGSFTIYMGDATNDQTITAAADHTYTLYDLKVSY